jgi:hypothetical protein
MHCDLNTELANYAVTCRQRAAQARRRADEIRAQPKAGSGWPEYDDAIEKQAAQFDAVADVWEERQEQAEQGLLLVDEQGMDLAWSEEFQDLLGKCHRASRVVYLEPMATADDGTSRRGL